MNTIVNLWIWTEESQQDVELMQKPATCLTITLHKAAAVRIAAANTRHANALRMV